MDELIGFGVVLLLLATVAFFAAALFWIFVILVGALVILCLWAAIESGRPSTRSPVREDPSG